MRIEGNYQSKGYALIRELIPFEVARAFMARLKSNLGDRPWPIRNDEVSPILKRNAVEFYGNKYPPVQSFLWALTAPMEQVTDRKLLPTYAYFRIYREGDICRVHRDRPACEHSLSLTLDYSDDVPWPLEVGAAGEDGPEEIVAEDFGEEPKSSLVMQVGDAVAYRGWEHRHGRTTPNPNGWSAHLFLHWVDRDGPHASQAFDGDGVPEPVHFTFA